MRCLIRAASSVCVSLALAAPALADCGLTRIAQMPLTPLGQHYAVMVTINDVARPMMVDTGSEVTLLKASFVNEFNLKPDNSGSRARRVAGVGQTTGDAHPNVIASTMAFGDLVYRDRSTVVATMDSGNTPENDAIGLLGDDILSQFDVELDFPSQKLTFYRAYGCYGTFLPWSGGYTAVPFEHKQAKIAFDVILNDERTRAIVDTGNNGSFVSRSASALWGVSPSEITSTTGRAQSPLNRGEAMPIDAYSFDKIKIGGDEFVGKQMGVIDVDFPLASANIGLDYWAKRKIWISYGNKWMFIADNPSSATIAYPVVAGEPTVVGDRVIDAAGPN